MKREIKRKVASMSREDISEIKFWLENKVVHYSDRYESGAKRIDGRRLTEAEAMLGLLSGIYKECANGGVCGPIMEKRKADGLRKV